MKSILKNTESKNHPEGITTDSVSEERKKLLKENQKLFDHIMRHVKSDMKNLPKFAVKLLDTAHHIEKEDVTQMVKCLGLTKVAIYYQVTEETLQKRIKRTENHRAKENLFFVTKELKED